MEDIPEDKIANSVLEGLPPSFLVFGKQKDLNPMEEFWMNKLTAIEKQYDIHIVDLERRLLSEKKTRRSIKKQSGKIAELEESLSEQITKLGQSTSVSNKLQGKLKEKEFEAKALTRKLERAVTVQRNVEKRMEAERKTRVEFEKESSDLKTKLRKLEKERKILLTDLEIKDSEKKIVEERESLINMEKWSFIKSLTDVDTERRIQTNTNVKLCEDIEKLLGVEKSLEMSLLKERKVMGELMEEMKQQREEHKKALRQLDLTIKQKKSVDEDLQFSFKKVKEKERDVLSGKEELRSKEAENIAKYQEIKDLKRRNSKIRCVLADTRQKLNDCLSEMKSLQNEKKRADVELESAVKHEKSLNLEIKRNELRRFKLAERILKAHPTLMMNRKDVSRGESISRRESGMNGANQNGEVESYKKQIWKLERVTDDLERRLMELKRKENIYKLKLNKFGEMEKRIFWTGKAMAKVEGDRQRLEDMLHTMETNMPVKIPFKKLVTDPSVLDRLAKNKVLQKRIFRQTEKMEELKGNARRLLQYREEEFGAMGQYSEDIPSWKLSFWKKQTLHPEGILAGLDINYDRRTRGTTGSLESFTDDSNYKNYLQFLDNEIPKLKDEIDNLERKKLFIEIEKENEESRRERMEEAASERKKFMGMLIGDEDSSDGAIAAEKMKGGYGSEGEEGYDGQCTPELSIHGSSYNDNKGGVTAAGVAVTGDVANIVQRKELSSLVLTDDDRNDDEDGSSEAASDIPTD